MTRLPPIFRPYAPPLKMRFCRIAKVLVVRLPWVDPIGVDRSGSRSFAVRFETRNDPIALRDETQWPEFNSTLWRQSSHSSSPPVSLWELIVSYQSPI